MRVAILQSNYIPWRGYFDLIDDVDLFIVYDDVQYTRRDWRNRNRIKGAGGAIWLTVPVHFSRDQPDNKIQDICIDNSQDWARKHLAGLKHCYAKARFFESYLEEIVELLAGDHEKLSELNVAAIRWAAKQLGIETSFRMSSEFDAQGEKTERLISILCQVGASVYLSGPSARNYIELEQFRQSGIGLEFKNYEYPEYPQLYDGFEPRVSVLDLLFNCGANARDYLKSIGNNEIVN